MKPFQLVLSLASLICALALPASKALADPWEGPRLSESQLLEIEDKETNYGFRAKRASGYIYSNKFDEIAKTDIVYAYIEAAMKQTAAAVALTEANASQSQHSPNVAIHASMIDGAVNGTHTLRNDSLIYLGVAMDVYSWFSKDPSYQEIQKFNLGNFQKRPSLYFVKVDRSTEIAQSANTNTVDEADKQLDDLFQSNQGFLLSLPLDCDIAYYRTTGLFGGRSAFAESGANVQYRAAYRPAEVHSRVYVCGTNEKDLGLGIALRNAITMTTLRSGENYWISKLSMPRLENNTFLRNKLKLPVDRKDYIAAELFKLIAPLLNQDWYAVYSAPNATGDWKVFVANGEKTYEFEAPAIQKQ